MAAVFWETETVVLGGETAIIYYAYVTFRGQGGGALDDNNSQIKPGVDILHQITTEQLIDSNQWVAVFGFHDGSYHFVVTQRNTEDGKSFGFPVGDGPGSLSGRTEYIYHTRGNNGRWQVGFAQSATAYNGYVDNNFSRRINTLGRILTETTYTQDDTVGYMPSGVTFSNEWGQLFTKGLLMDKVGSTQPFFKLTGTNPASKYVQAPLVYNVLVGVEYLTSNPPLFQPNEIQFIFTDSGLTGSPFNQIESITATYPSNIAGREWGIAAFNFTFGVIGEQSGGRTQAIGGLNSGTGVPTTQKLAIFTTIEPVGYVKPPPYNTPTTDNVILPGGHFV